MPTNTLGNYNQTFFAQEALIQLEKVLGFAGRIYRAYNTNPAVRGDTIQVRRPASFTATAAPAAAMNLTTESVAVKLDEWDEVKFALTDKDLSLTAPQIITDHIRPAAVALADLIDQKGVALYKKVPWYTALTATPVLADIATARKVMFDNKVPLRDAAMLHAMIGGTTEVAFLTALAAGGMSTQDPSIREASMGRLFGFDVWANQNTPSHTPGTGTADPLGAVVGVNAIGATSIACDTFTAGNTFTEGDTFSIAGDTQRYVLTALATVAGPGTVTLAIYPALKKPTAGAEVVTFYAPAAAKTQNLLFHRNAFCMATAPLSTLGGELGARIVTVNDPITGISLRSRMFYEGTLSEVHVALDVLYGFKTLDPNLAVRAYQA